MRAGQKAWWGGYMRLGGQGKSPFLSPLIPYNPHPHRAGHHCINCVEVLSCARHLADDMGNAAFHSSF